MQPMHASSVVKGGCSLADASIDAHYVVAEPRRKGRADRRAAASARAAPAVQDADWRRALSACIAVLGFWLVLL